MVILEQRLCLERQRQRFAPDGAISRHNPPPSAGSRRTLSNFLDGHSSKH
jgi:hypothetical protein